jgi:hypothetical protein
MTNQDGSILARSVRGSARKLFCGPSRRGLRPSHSVQEQRPAHNNMGVSYQTLRDSDDNIVSGRATRSPRCE